ncbi:WXG100 family type VII secretion target [Miniphocaeibacter massiliensis]|uniref:WXG100 family type VII secretion target n=1 Tax=Miniphocaeibacter massiliensis TaxID=2041841 RepID=UPI000C1BB56C|nr:WXG100 family type VII secretion target [Miniphocaeibacter massiliensis]
MSHMKIDPSEVQGHANSMRNTGEQSLEDAKTTLVNMVNQLVDGIWEGEGARGYQDRFNQVADPSFAAIKEAINNLCDDLITNANNYERFDQESKQANMNV